MALIQSRRGGMTLFSGRNDVLSHQVRFVCGEKGIAVEVVYLDPAALPENLAEISPYLSIPVFVDRDLDIYEARVLVEYLDERFPHPPMMPADPVSRARSRLMLVRIQRDLYAHLDAIGEGGKGAMKSRQELVSNLVAISPIFERATYFMSEELSLVDCALAPLLWRLPSLKIDLPGQARPLQEYADRIFRREAFKASLSDVERALR